MTRYPRMTLAVAALLMSACGVSNEGAPTPDGPRLPYANILPPRTAELDLRDLDPCQDLLTHEQLRELKYALGYSRPPLPDRSDIHGGPDCSFAADRRNVMTLVGIATTEDARTWVADPHRAHPDVRPTVERVDPFYALVLPHPLLEDDCLVVVDTAPNQYLEVSSSSGGLEPIPGGYCPEALRVARMAVDTAMN